MKVLVISNMYPSPQKPYAGVFVKNQVEKLNALEGPDTVDCYYMLRTFTGKIGSIMKYLKAFISFFPWLGRKYDIVHVHFFYPLIVLGYLYKLMHPKSRLIVTFHGSDITRHINGGINQLIFKTIASRIDKVISVGYDLAAEVEAKLNIRDQIILSAGVDQDVFYPVETEKAFDFIFVGSFVERKGIDLLIDAIQKLNDKTIRYCIVGSGKFSEQIKNLKKLGFNVMVYENRSQDELRILYNRSKYFILPSREEPFGLVCTEAIFCGTPAIVTRVGGLKEQVVQGVNGCFIEEVTSDAIVNTLKKQMSISEVDYRQLVKTTLDSNKKYSLNDVCIETLKIYNTMLK